MMQIDNDREMSVEMVRALVREHQDTKFTWDIRECVTRLHKPPSIAPEKRCGKRPGTSRVFPFGTNPSGGKNQSTRQQNPKLTEETKRDGPEKARPSENLHQR